MTKADIVAKVIDNEETIIAELESALERFRNASDLDEQATMDMDDMSHANQAKDMQLRMQVQYNKAVEDLNELKKRVTGSYTSVASGSLVTAGKTNFLVGISIHALALEDGAEVLGVSTQSPAFAAMTGLKKGDKFELGTNKYTIDTVA